MAQKYSSSSIVLPNIKESQEIKGILNFTLEQANVSIANAIRRTILSDIKMVVLNPKNIQIIKNTTRFNNEIIKQRIGCIPVHIKVFEGIENLIIELNAENKHDSLVYITTKNFKIKNKLTDTYLTEQAIKKIFPPNKITDSYILIARLRPKISDIIPGEVLHLTSTLDISTAADDGMFNAVSTIGYENTPDKVEQDDKWQTIASELQKNKVSKSQVTYKRQDWYTLQAKRFYIDDSFDFQVESVGVYSNLEIMQKACNILINKLKKISEMCDAENLDLDKESTAIENCVEVILKGEDYTIGKVIEYILHYDYYLHDKQLSFVGFIKKHPHDTFSIIRLAFINEEHFTDTNIYAMIKFACLTGINIFNNIKEAFI